ncbi:MAG: putative glycoside hydrolase [Anaerolineales bacterium]
MPKHRLYSLAVLITLLSSACSSGAPPSAVKLPTQTSFSEPPLRVHVTAENRTLKLGLCDFSADSSLDGEFQFMERYPDFVAARYDALVDGSVSPERAAFLKENNPDMLLLAYWDIFILPFDQSSDMPEEVFLHDADTGNRIVYTSYPGHFLMDPASEEWREHTLARVEEMLVMGYDGVHLDDVWADLELHGGPNFVQADSSGNLLSEPYQETPSWYSKEIYMEDTKNFITFIEGNIGPAITYYNGLNENPGFDEAYYLPAADGVGLEAPLVADWVEDGIRGNESFWSAALEAYLSVPENKIVSWIDFGKRDEIQSRLYSLASYLLVMRQDSYYMYTPQCWHLTYLPEWDLDFGQPLNSPANLADLRDPETGLYLREYTNSLVLVNPDDTNLKTIQLEGEYLKVIPVGGNIPELGGEGRLTFERVSSLTLQPQEGALLLKIEANPNTTLTITTAGVPKYLSETRDYDVIFSELSKAGVTSFFPTFQYQEIPQALSLGYETDFFPPCSSQDPAFQSLREHNIKLVVPGEMLYPRDNFPPLEDDPLLALLDCTGPGGIAAVLSIDEPFGAIRNPENPYQDVAALYERVKQVMPEIPVMMVHAPIPAYIEENNGSFRPVTQEEIDYYLGEVLNFSIFSDSFGFDVYPIPTDVAGLATPYQTGEVTDYGAAIADYTRWLRENAGDKPYFMVLQGFPYSRLFDASKVLPAPTGAELQEMACLTWQGGVSDIIWWGQGFLLEEDEPLWQNILEVSTGIEANPAGYCERRSASSTSTAPLFQEDFENAAELIELFPQDGSRWHGLQQQPDANLITLTDEQYHTGSSAIKFAAQPYDGSQASKADIYLGGLVFENGDEVWTEMWVYLSGGTDSANLFLWDLEASKTCILLSCQSPGRRLYFSGPNGDWLKSDLGKWHRGKDFHQTSGEEISFPKDRWVRLRVYLFLSPESNGVMRVWQDENLILDETGITLPKADAIYDRWQVGITANGNEMDEATLYLDEISIWDQNPGW